MENNLSIDENIMEELSEALFEDAVENGEALITFDALKTQMNKYEGLLENLGLIIDDLLFPQNSRKQNDRMMTKAERMFSIPRSPFSIGLTILLLVNTVLFCHRGTYFKDFPMLNGFTPNVFYLLSRSCGIFSIIAFSKVLISLIIGRTLLLNSVLSLLCVLRYSITILRKLGLASVLPLDYNISFHKIIGFLIFIQAWIHTVMHLLNFGENSNYEVNI